MQASTEKVDPYAGLTMPLVSEDTPVLHWFIEEFTKKEQRGKLPTLVDYETGFKKFIVLQRYIRFVKSKMREFTKDKMIVDKLDDLSELLQFDNYSSSQFHYTHVTFKRSTSNLSMLLNPIDTRIMHDKAFRVQCSLFSGDILSLTDLETEFKIKESERIMMLLEAIAYTDERGDVSVEVTSDDVTAITQDDYNEFFVRYLHFITKRSFGSDQFVSLIMKKIDTNGTEDEVKERRMKALREFKNFLSTYPTSHGFDGHKIKIMGYFIARYLFRHGK